MSQTNQRLISDSIVLMVTTLAHHFKHNVELRYLREKVGLSP